MDDRLVGFIGLGIMGLPMARNLQKAGVRLMVGRRSRAASEDLAAHGAKVGDAADIGRACHVIFTMLPSGPVAQEVLFGPGGVSEGLRPGAIICDMSSVRPDESRLCYVRLHEMEVGFVDAPVSGGEPMAVDGTLAFMAGGDPADFDALLPYFEIMGSSAVLVGASGAGSLAKLANQIIVNLNIAAVGEALVMAAKAGVDPARVFAAIRGGLAGSAVLEAKAPMMLARDFRPGGKISIIHKDLTNALAAAHAAGSPTFLTAQLYEMVESLMADGRKGEDHSAIVRFFERVAGVELKGGDPA